MFTPRMIPVLLQTHLGSTRPRLFEVIPFRGVKTGATAIAPAAGLAAATAAAGAAPVANSAAAGDAAGLAAPAGPAAKVITVGGGFALGGSSKHSFSTLLAETCP